MEHTIIRLAKGREFQWWEKNPLYVLSTDVKENIVYVGEGADHPGLYRLALKVLKKKIHFVSEQKQY